MEIILTIAEIASVGLLIALFCYARITAGIIADQKHEIEQLKAALSKAKKKAAARPEKSGGFRDQKFSLLEIMDDDYIDNFMQSFPSVGIGDDIDFPPTSKEG